MAASRRLARCAGSGLPVRLGLLLLWGAALASGAASEPGRWHFVAAGNQSKSLFVFPKTMFSGTQIILKFLEKQCSSQDVLLNISWYLRSSRCHDEVYIDENKALLYLSNHERESSPAGGGQYIWYRNVSRCDQLSELHIAVLPKPRKLKPLPEAQAASPPVSEVKKRDVSPATDPKKAGKEEKTKAKAAGGDQVPSATRTVVAPPLPNEKAGDQAKKEVPAAKEKMEVSTVATTWEDGPYVFIFSIESLSNAYWEVSVDLQMKHPEYQYISASEWPLMMFYMVMCIVYVLYGVLWLVLLACYWRDILRIQFWIGGVILLGMLEKAVFYAEFQSIQNQGVSVQGAVIFAEVLCAVKRMLARVLVIIASLGYGIVKPRLGALLNRVVGVGLMYLVFSIIEGILRLKSEQTKPAALLCEIFLAFLDSCIVWWISFTRD
uniref:Transmembrane protein 87B n=1 Tax=Salvator merianae TaxID=96440 RepID=A0A8D0CAX6_SALMN